MKKLKSDSSSGAFNIESMTPLPAHVTRFTPAPAYEIKFAAKKLDSKDMALLGKSSGIFSKIGPSLFYWILFLDPFFKVTVKPTGQPPITLYRSEFLPKTTDPHWKPFNLNVKDVFGYDNPFTITVYDSDKDGGHDLIGTFDTTLRELTFQWFERALYNQNKKSL